jgi:hypothetical protein
VITGYELAEDAATWLLVETRADGRVGVAGEGSTTVAGVAIAGGPGNEDLSAVAGGGAPVWRCPGLVDVVSGGDEAHVVYAELAEEGAELVAAAGGRVRPAGPGTDARVIAGICTEPGGVSAINGFGLMRTV